MHDLIDKLIDEWAAPIVAGILIGYVLVGPLRHWLHGWI